VEGGGWHGEVVKSGVLAAWCNRVHRQND
jgi:hypothetical protein